MGKNQESIENLEPGAKVYGLDPNGNWVELSLDANGEIDVTFNNDSIQLIDPDDEIAEFEALGTTLGGNEVAIITKLSEALTSVANEEVRVDLQSDNLSNNLDVDIAEQSLAQLTTVIEADDDAGNTNEIQGEELGTALGGTETAIITYIAQALTGVGNDQLRVDLQNNNAGTLSVEQQTPIKIEGDDDDGNTITINAETLSQSITDPDGLVTYLSRALSTQGADEVRVDLQSDNLSGNIDVDIAEQSLAQLTTVIEADDDAGNTAEIQGEELGTALDGTETAIITYLCQALTSIGNDQVRVDLQNNNAGDIGTKSQAGNASSSSVNLGTSDTQLLSSTSDRRNFTVKNNGGDTIFIELGGNAADTTDGMPLDAGESYTDEQFTGEVRGIANSGTQDVRIIEVTA